MEGRQWSDGLHQAVEAKERVPIKQETQTLATITLQNFFKLYKALSGMTGTAQTEAEEFNKIYKLEVVTIPTNRPVVRQDNEDRVYRKEREKWEAIIDEIKALQRRRPARAGRHHQRREERDALDHAQAQVRHRARGAQRQVPRARVAHRRPRRPDARQRPRRDRRQRHHRHQHGRPRHRHQAGRGDLLRRDRPRPKTRPAGKYVLTQREHREEDRGGHRRTRTSMLAEVFQLGPAPRRSAGCT